MKILKNNYLDNQEKNDKQRFTCEYCDSELEIEKDELEIGKCGLYEFTCPCCNRVNIIDDGIKLDENNLEYPKHFYDFSHDNIDDVSDKEINECIKKCIKTVKNGESYSSIATKNVIVIATPYNDGYDKYINIIVAKNYQDVDIDFD